VTDSSKQSNQTDLLNFLLEEKIISSAQVTVARADMEVSGLSAAEVLIARRWVTEEKLMKVAPWLEGLQAPAMIEAAATNKNAASTTTYQENLKKYRRLMARILGEAEPH
jgi:hypothetical protein